MADWDILAKGLSDAGKTVALGMMDRNRMKVEDYYQREAEKRAIEQEQIIHERNRAAEMADRQKLMKEEKELAAIYERQNKEFEADMKQWGNNPELRLKVEELRMRADTLGDAEARKEAEGYGKLAGAIAEGKLETELDEDMRTTLKNMDPEMALGLRDMINNNKAKKIQNDYMEEMTRYYRWLQNPRTKEIETERLTWEQINKMRNDRLAIYEDINNREKEEKFLLGRQKAIELGVDPLEDPKLNANWNALAQNPKNKNASLMLAYEESWKQIAALKGSLFLINKALYRLDPAGTDPEQYARDLAEAQKQSIIAEKQAKGIPIEPEVAEEDIPAPPPVREPGAAHKLFVDTIYEKGPKALFVSMSEAFKHRQDLEDFQKEVKYVYGADIKAKAIKLLTDQAGLWQVGTRDIGMLFYDPHKRVLVRVVQDPLDKNGVKLDIVPKTIQGPTAPEK